MLIVFKSKICVNEKWYTYYVTSPVRSVYRVGAIVLVRDEDECEPGKHLLNEFYSLFYAILIQVQ